MIAGLILCIVGLVLLAAGMVLPRIALRLHNAIQTIPLAMQDMASSLVPGLSVGLRLRAMMPKIARLCLGVGGFFIAFGLYAFIARPVPLWLLLFAYLMLLVLVVLIVALFLVLKRFAPTLRELAQFTKGRL
jgi:hypothetical protein